ncbi:protein C12orf4 [Coccinella septempunctata]|uniref:protein C12orf4 n=1 Tax=Coccinella septempunctata TaxID=41139 RepID=UPI001D07B534|nr:protein C12orf4 [Coccinella septempunctata]
MIDDNIITVASYSNESFDKLIEKEIPIPFNESVEELAHILITKYELPKYIETLLVEDLTLFINSKEKELYDTYSEDKISKAKEDTKFLDDLTKQWETLFKDETAEYAEKKCASDEELFASAYHKLVHSPALETILSVEHLYAKAVRRRTDQKDAFIQDLSEKQTQEMNKAVDSLEYGMTEFDINELVTKHYEDHSLLKVRYASELDTLKEAQRREYRDWVMKMLEFNQENSFPPSPSSSICTPTSPLLSGPDDMIFLDSLNKHREKEPILEESFTIHLGSQLKQMYNVRILTGSVEDLCIIPVGESSEPTPQLLQTALDLYSNDLSGLVLMTDNKIGSRVTKAFQENCLRSTEFHFSHIDAQLEKISNLAGESNASINGSRSLNSDLQCGDFYLTKHSNLAQVHVIFHLVSDDGLRGSDINSRHPVILGLRNVLKTACSNDITSLTIPLLLQYDITEEMTTLWCERRAELVFKCMKGFMIEMASWGGSDLKNLQFMLPSGISSQVFHSLADMLPRIFKISNPKILN